MERFKGKKYDWIKRTSFLKEETLRILIIFPNHQLKFEIPIYMREYQNPKEVNNWIQEAIKDHLAFERWYYSQEKHKGEIIGKWKQRQLTLTL